MRRSGVPGKSLLKGEAENGPHWYAHMRAEIKEPGAETANSIASSQATLPRDEPCAKARRSVGVKQLRKDENDPSRPRGRIPWRTFTRWGREKLKPLSSLIYTHTRRMVGINGNGSRRRKGGKKWIEKTIGGGFLPKP